MTSMSLGHRSSAPDRAPEFEHHPAPQVVLASRTNGGIRVTLLWTADTDTVAVLVRDSCLGEQFELVVEPCVNALDVYKHPYAYAAWRGVDYRIEDLSRAA